MPRYYPPEFRAELVRKMIMPRGPSVGELSAKSGVHKSTLSRWLHEATTVRTVMAKDDTPAAPVRARRPEDVPPEDTNTIRTIAVRSPTRPYLLSHTGAQPGAGRPVPTNRPQ
jgi:transposase-like protein